MRRRDTIIIAVLVNAALLMILFATAIRSGDSQEEAAKKGITHTDLAATLHSAPSHEDLLNEYISSVPTLAERDHNTLYSFEEAELAIAPSPAIPIDKPAPVSPSLATSGLESSRPKSERDFVNVTVKKGDFLEKIAKANNTTTAAIMKANAMNSTQLKIGQVLKVPLSGDKKGSTPTPSLTPKDGEFYVVREGDNPWLIASRNKINLEELLRLNGLDEQKAKRLRPGDKLKIR